MKTCHILLLFNVSSLFKRPLADLFHDIIKRCKQGDRKAQETVYNLLAGKMFAVCLRYCPNYEEARDLLHDGFVTIYTKIGQFHQEGSFEGWVRRIFVNQAMEKWRNDNKLMMINSVEDVDRQIAVPENEVEDDWEAYQLTEAEMLELVDELPAKYKIVFNLYVIDGLSHRDIAEKIGISEGASRSNLLRARSILQKQIKDQVDSMKLKSNASK